MDAEAAQRYSMSPVVVAKRDLASGERLEVEALAVRPMPTAYLPGGTFAAGDAASLLGRRLANDLKRGEALQHSALQPVLLSLSRTLPAGVRALTVSVDELNAHSGLLRAGDNVDVYLVEHDGARSRIGLLQDKLRVLATGSRTEGLSPKEGNNASQDFGTVTLQVDDGQARRLVLARQAGELSFVLRAEGDESPAPDQLLDSRYLLAPSVRQAGAGRPRRQAGDAVELLIGGGGGPAPARHWLRVASPAAGDGGV
jgi:pilus assembly protein CpaB